MSTRTRTRTLASLLVCVATASGCRAPAVWRYEESLERAAKPSVHGVHEERLVTLMRDLDRLRSERLPKALDPREEEERRVREVARVARAMAASAVEIREAEPAWLGEGERKEFRALAQELERLAIGFADDLPRLSPAERSARIDVIDANCDLCHDRFRIPRNAGERG